MTEPGADLEGTILNKDDYLTAISAATQNTTRYNLLLTIANEDTPVTRDFLDDNTEASTDTLDTLVDEGLLKPVGEVKYTLTPLAEEIITNVDAALDEMVETERDALAA